MQEERISKMAESDLSKIVNLIMENPALIEQIKQLGASSETANEAPAQKTIPEPPEESGGTQEGLATYQEKPQGNSKRRELLYAIKPYLSNERGKAIETILSIADIIDMMKTR